jgi:hypothetical protein
MTSCALCQRSISPGLGYCVRIDVYADPHLPPMTTDEIEASNFDATLSGLTQQIQSMSAEELQDGVHRRLEYQLCAVCHKRYLANPLGMPRAVRTSSN